VPPLQAQLLELVFYFGAAGHSRAAPNVHVSEIRCLMMP
jgi:hypothetical protein